MILRKPYALFIKYFRLLHLFLAVLAGLILYRSFSIYNFFRIYSIDYRSVTRGGLHSGVAPINYFFLIVILIITIILLVVSIYKSKPKKLYIFMLILYVLVFVMFFYCDGIIGNSSSVLLDIKTSKALRDFSLMFVLMESIGLLLIVFRAIGFDIKKFDFGSDLQQLDISEKDSEEIEVALEFDQDEVKRNIRKRLRNAKYVYFENKFIISIIVLGLLLLIGSFTYLRMNAFGKKYNTGKTFSSSGYSFNVRDSFIVDYDLSGKKLADGVVVAVRIQMKSSLKKAVFNSGTITLQIGDLAYGSDYKYAKLLSDLGSAYVKQTVTSEFETYLFTFVVSESQANKKMELKINNGSSSFVRLKPIDLRKEDANEYSKKLKERIDLGDSVLGSSNLIIDSVEVSDFFKLDYKFCLSKDKCYDSSEYLAARASGNYFKTLMKISGRFNVDKSINSSSIHDFSSFLNNYGYIHYKIRNDWIKFKINSSEITPKISKTNDVFVEIPYEVKDANDMYFTFVIRNKSYKYALK